MATRTSKLRNITEGVGLLNTALVESKKIEPVPPLVYETD
jgi:hypothetical protein